MFYPRCMFILPMKAPTPKIPVIIFIVLIHFVTLILFWHDRICPPFYWTSIRSSFIRYKYLIFPSFFYLSIGTISNTLWPLGDLNSTLPPWKGDVLTIRLRGLYVWIILILMYPSIHSYLDTVSWSANHSTILYTNKRNSTISNRCIIPLLYQDNWILSLLILGTLRLNAPWRTS